MSSAILFLSALLLPLVASQTIDSKPLCNNPDFGRNVASPMSCEEYYSCDDFGPKARICPAGQWFDLSSNRCQPQALVECYLLKDVPVETDIKCPINGDDNTLFYRVSKVACDRYYICYMGRASGIRCPTGLWWNQLTLECDDPKNVNCQIANDEGIDDPVVSSTTPRPPAQQFNCPQTGVEFLPHPEHCNWFIYCRNGSSSIQQCQFMQHFDTVTKQCKFKFDATCDIPDKSEKI